VGAGSGSEGRDKAVVRLGGDPPSPYEQAFSFSRIVTAGEFIMIGGTTSVDPCGFVLGETPYEQAVEILRKLGRELSRAGSAPANVVNLRVYVTDISRADEVGRAVGEAFAEIRPLMTMVEVSGLIDPRMLVEIEAVAYRAA
jgi:enamine deaminase RidA (YjgF/YER057c/UK114 family)